MTVLVYILNGPNLNLLGQREPEFYGSGTLDDLRSACETHVKDMGATLEFRQTNHEGELIDWLQEAGERADAVVLNPAGLGHTSVALHDAVKAIDAPVIEVHLSQPAAREAFRAHSYVSSAAKGTISGFGQLSYLLGLDAALAEAVKT